jgi:hypothetical protein
MTRKYCAYGSMEGRTAALLFMSRLKGATLWSPPRRHAGYLAFGAGA